MTREAIITSFVAWDAFASYGDTYALRLKYAKKVSVIIGVDVKSSEENQLHEERPRLAPGKAGTEHPPEKR